MNVSQLVRGRPKSGVAVLYGGRSRVIIGLVLLAIAISMLYPMLLMILTSFKTLPDFQANPTGWPQQWTFDNYVTAWRDADVGTYTINSVRITALSLAMTLVVVTPAAFAFAKLRFRGRSLILGAILSLIIVPGVMQLVPVFKIANTFNLIDSHVGLAMIYNAFGISFGIYLLSGYLEGVPSTIFEAAEIDGCNIFQIFVRIALPIAKPGLATVMTFAFLNYWNEFLLGFIILLDASKRPLPVGLKGLEAAQGYVSQPLLAAGVTITMIPSAIVFLALQRKLSEGLTAGVSK